MISPPTITTPQALEQVKNQIKNSFTRVLLSEIKNFKPHFETIVSESSNGAIVTKGCTILNLLSALESIETMSIVFRKMDGSILDMKLHDIIYDENATGITEENKKDILENFLS